MNHPPMSVILHSIQLRRIHLGARGLAINLLGQPCTAGQLGKMLTSVGEIS